MSENLIISIVVIVLFFTVLLMGIIWPTIMERKERLRVKLYHEQNANRLKDVIDSIEAVQNFHDFHVVKKWARTVANTMSKEVQDICKTDSLYGLEQGFTYINSVQRAINKKRFELSKK